MSYEQQMRVDVLRMIADDIITKNPSAELYKHIDEGLACTFNDSSLNSATFTLDGRAFDISPVIISARAPKLWHHMQNNWVIKGSSKTRLTFDMPKDVDDRWNVGEKVWMRLLFSTYSGHYFIVGKAKLGFKAAIEAKYRYELLEWNHPIDDIKMLALATTFEMEDLKKQATTLIEAWLEHTPNHPIACENFTEYPIALRKYTGAPLSTPIFNFLLHWFFRHEAGIMKFWTTNNQTYDDFYETLRGSGAIEIFEAHAKPLRKDVIPCVDPECGPRDRSAAKADLVGFPVNAEDLEEGIDREMVLEAKKTLALSQPSQHMEIPYEQMTEAQKMSWKQRCANIFLGLPRRQQKELVQRLPASAIRSDLLQALQMEEQSGRSANTAIELD